MSSPSLRLAVIINTEDPEPLRLMRESYVSIFNQFAPGSSVEFFNGVIGDRLPSLGQDGPYDLLVLGGGTAIPDPTAPWLARLKDFERGLYKNHPEQRVVGICLGHQTSAEVLGGELGYMSHPELAVLPLKLTERGQNFFNKLGRVSTLNLHEFHRREIVMAQPGFQPLAASNQILLSNNGKVLTFQGHPEMTGDLMRQLLSSKASVVAGYLDEDMQAAGKAETREGLLARADLKHDGLAVWECIMGWVKKGDEQSTPG